MDAFPDDEAEAMAELSRRREALVRRTVVLSMVSGLAFGALLFAGAWGLGLMSFVGAFKVMSFVAAATAMAMAIKGSAFIVRRQLARRAPVWIDELSTKYKLDKKRLEEIASLWS